MSTFLIGQGKTLPALVATVLDGTGAPRPISSATGATFVMQTLGGDPAVSAPMTILDDGVDPTLVGKVRYGWVSADTASAGTYLARIVVTFGPGATESFPDGSWDRVVISPSTPAVPGPLFGPYTDWCTRRSLDDFGVDTTADVGLDIAAASEILYVLSGRRFPGLGVATIRPATERCGCGCHTYGGPLYGLGAFIGGFGTGLGSPVSWGAYSDRCCPPTIYLGHDARSVLSVQIDGDVLDAANYRLYRRTGDLVRLADPTSGSNPGWPCCQRDDLVSGAGTFEVTYQFGADPPLSGSRAASELAARSVKGGLTDLVNEASMWTTGKTGLYWVDLFLSTFNPNHLKRRARVFSVDVPPHRRIS